MKSQTKVIKASLLFFCLFFLNTISAQLTGKIDFPTLGISFHVPEGWSGTEVTSGFAINSPENKGVIIIITHNVHSILEMEQEAKNGFQISENTLLTLENGVEKIMDNAIAGLYTGTIDTKPAKALIVGMINPYGYGLTIISTAKSSQFTDNLKRAGLSVSKSVVFYNPKIQGNTIESKEKSTELTQLFKNCRLTYLESYNTAGGGYGKKITIDLCGQGYFNHSAYNSMGMDTGGASAGYGSNNKGTGQWKTYVNAHGQDVLQLNFYNGEVYEYIVTIDEADKTYLNGDRYFRVYDGDYGPDCN